MKLRSASFPARGELAPCSKPQAAILVSAFTLIELMIVVGIMGLIAAMGVPSIAKALQKDGMRKAVSDVEDV